MKKYYFEQLVQATIYATSEEDARKQLENRAVPGEWQLVDVQDE